MTTDTPTPISMLMLVAAPFAVRQDAKLVPVTPLDIQQEITSIEAACRQIGRPVGLEVDIKVATSTIIGHYFATCSRAPDILHFTGHGSPAYGGGAMLLLEDAVGQGRFLDHHALEGLLRPTKPVPCRLAFLSACHSEGLAQALLNLGVPHVVVINAQDAVLDIAAREFATRLYASLLSGRSVAHAFEAARSAVRHQDRLESAGEGQFEAPKFKLLPKDDPLHQQPLFEQIPAGAVTIKQAQPDPTLHIRTSNEVFVGRGSELSELSTALIKAQQRVFHIQGFGGMGKSSLAFAFGLWASQRAHWIDGVKLVELRAFSTVEQTRLPIALALGLDPKAAESNISLAVALGRRNSLLILDDLDALLHPDDGQPKQLQELLKALLTCENLSILTTSRADLPSGFNHKKLELRRLLPPEDQRAFRAYHPPEHVWAEKEDLAALFKLLDGYPFAIKLAAHYLESATIGLSAYLQRLTSDAQHTFVYPGSAEDRETSLFATLDLSYTSLPQIAQRAFAYLSFFPAGIWYNWYEQIFGQDVARALETLNRYGMVDLLTFNGGNRRVRLPEPARHYAEACLSAEEPSFLGPKILKFYTQLIGEAYELMSSEHDPQQAVALITSEWPNIERWLRWGYINEPLESDQCLSARATAQLDRYWMWSDARAQDLPLELLTQASETAQRTGDQGNQANTRQALGDLYQFRKELGRAEEAYMAALALFEAVADRLGQANTRKALGDLYQFRKELGRAEEAYMAALALFEAVDSRLGQANTRKALGDLYQFRKELGRAEEAYMAALALFEAVDSRLGQANTRKALGDLYRYRDELGRAEEAYMAALALFEAVADRLGQANTRQALGDLYQFRKELGRAEEAYMAALALFEAVADRLGQANTRQALGDLYQFRKELGRAEEAYMAALALFEAVADRLGQANTRQALGDLYQFRKELGRAEEAYMAALALFEAVDSRLGQANTYGSLSQLYLQKKEDEKAQAYLKQALELFSQMSDDRYSPAALLGNVGITLKQRGDHDQARPYLLQAAEIFEQIGLQERAERHRQMAAQGGDSMDHIQQLAITIVLAINGVEQAQQTLQQLAQQASDHPLIKAIQALMNGERDRTILLSQESQLDEQGQHIIQLALELLEDPLKLQALIEALQGGDQQTQIKRLILMFVHAAQGIEQAQQAAEQWLSGAGEQEQLKAVAKVMRLVIAGERKREVLLANEHGLDDADRALLTSVLDLLDDPAKLQAFEQEQNGNSETQARERFKHLAVTCALAAQGVEQAQQAAEQWLSTNGEKEQWRNFAMVMRMLLNGERTREVLLAQEHGLDDTDQAIVSLTLELLDDPAKLEQFVQELNGAQAHQPLAQAAELGMPLVNAILGDGAQKQAFIQQLAGLSTEDAELQTFVQAAEECIFGATPRSLVERFTGPWLELWQKIVFFVETDNVNMKLIEEWKTNTIAVFGSAQEQREAWSGVLKDTIRPRFEARANTSSFINDLIALLEADGDAEGLGTHLAPSYRMVWEQIVAGVAAHRQPQADPWEPLIAQVVVALRGGPTERMAEYHRLSGLVSDDIELRAFIAVAQQAMFGDHLAKLGTSLNGRAAQAWANVQAQVAA